MGSHNSKHKSSPSTASAASATSATSTDSKTPTHSAAPASPEQQPTSTSKLSRGLSLSTRHKLQPSQSKQDKEEMKEPPNYYSRRSKSLRRKAGVDQISGEGSGAGGGLGL